MKIGYTTFSETGKRRVNQDVCRVAEMPKQNRILMIVCDGMGGHSMGDVAADVTCCVMERLYIRPKITPTLIGVRRL